VKPTGESAYILPYGFYKKFYAMGLKLNVYAGFLNEVKIRVIKPYVERVSFDFVYDNRSHKWSVPP